MGIPSLCSKSVIPNRKHQTCYTGTIYLYLYAIAHIQFIFGFVHGILCEIARILSTILWTLYISVIWRYAVFAIVKQQLRCVYTCEAPIIKSFSGWFNVGTYTLRYFTVTFIEMNIKCSYVLGVGFENRSQSVRRFGARL